ncbi:MAG: fructose-bisphosphate aldolase class I [Candidatus Marinimicrobia bacterium]|nr:fructose-bisphosphate aldolase class I [Candidatus Neomarinimicrobiota bacterium]|tara:strand:- start:7519 stop:8541 length:1023 start_codon:yes stop_codon:yes gene_type:complete
MNLEQLEKTAMALAVPGKGILAADESTGTNAKRFETINLEPTEESRRAYRNMLFTSDGIENYISGVILFDETIRQSSLDNIPFPKLLSEKGVIPGIKVDKGAHPLSGFEDEFVTDGLDGLRDRLSEYYQLGARFAKWRGVITIGEDMPSFACVDANAHALARYSALCQEADIVPIVEPEILMNGNHSIDTSFDVTVEVLSAVFDALSSMDVFLEGIILKPNMVLSGYDAEQQASVNEVAEATVTCFQRSVPVSVPGICFLSGGQKDIRATEHLNAMNQLDTERPWKISFSYGRALQDAALSTWKGDENNVGAAQSAFIHRAKCNGAATTGHYSEAMEAGE